MDIDTKGVDNLLQDFVDIRFVRRIILLFSAGIVQPRSFTIIIYTYDYCH